MGDGEVTLSHSLRVRQFLDDKLVSIIGEKGVKATIVEFLPQAENMDRMSKTAHKQRTLAFGILFGSMAVVGIIVLEILRLLMNCYIRSLRRKEGLPVSEGGGCCGSSMNGRPEGYSDSTTALLERTEDGRDLENVEEERDAEVQEQEEEAEEEAEAMQKRLAGYDPQDLFFVAYQHTYIFSCLGLASYAFLNDYLSEDCGLDYELYAPWVLGTIIVHFVCLLYIFVHGVKTRSELPSTLGVIPKTVFVPFDSHLGTLRDAVAAGIYARHSFDPQNQSFWGPLVLACISVFCMFLPNLWIYCDVYPFRDFQDGYWPIIMDYDKMKLAQQQAARKKKLQTPGKKPESNAAGEDSSLFGMLQAFALKQLDAQTREHKQAQAWLGDVPQAVVGYLFLWMFSSKDSMFILFVVVLAAVKSGLIIILRPHILCALASFGLPWSHLTELDVNRAIGCSNVCTWTCRSKACRGLLKDEQTAPRVRVAAIFALKKLYDASKKRRENPSSGCQATGASEEEMSIQYSVLWEVATQLDPLTQKAAQHVMFHIAQGDDNWTKAAGLLRRLRNPDPDEKKQAALELAKSFQQYAGAFVGDLVRLLETPPPSRFKGSSDVTPKMHSQESVSRDNDAESKESWCGGLCGLSEAHRPDARSKTVTEDADVKAHDLKAYLSVREVREAASRALGILGQSKPTGSEPPISEKVATQVVVLLKHADHEVRSAALSAVVQFRGPAAKTAVKFALNLLKLQEELRDAKEKRKAAEIVLVELLPGMPDDIKKVYVKSVVELLKANNEASRAALRLLSRMGGPAAEAVKTELDDLTEACLPKDMADKIDELKKVVACQQRAVDAMGGGAAASEGLNLVLDRREDAVKEAKAMLKEVRDGKEVFEVLASRKEGSKAVKLKDSGSGNSSIFPVFFTDLEPDDTMFIAEMWKYLREAPEGCCKPLVIFSADLDGKDGGDIFEKKILLAALMLGQTDYLVLTPETPSKVSDKDIQHPLSKKLAGLRQQNLEATVSKLRAFKGAEMKFYICAPGRGNLGSLVKLLQDGRKEGDLGIAKSSLYLYSGQFNIKGMTDSDLSAMYELVGNTDPGCKDPKKKKPGVLVDAAKFPFFGGLDNHKLTKAFTTFALPSFAPLLSSRHPLIAAIWALINDEFNKKLIAPEKLFEEHVGVAADKQKLEDLYKEGKVKEYAQFICKYSHLEEKVVPKKKVTLKAFACDCCDAPLCDQLIFLIDWVTKMQPEAHVGSGQVFRQTWVKDEVGIWNFNKIRQYTSVDTRSTAPGMKGKQPVMRAPHDVEALYLMSEALQEYTLGHLCDLSETMSPADVRGTCLFK